MTDTLTLAEAIAELCSYDPTHPWTLDDVHLMQHEDETIKAAVATVLNAVLSGDLAPRAPEAQPVALYEGCFGVIKGDRDTPQEVVQVEFLPGNGFVVMVPGWTFFYEADGSCPGAEAQDIIATFPTRAAAEAFLRGDDDVQEAMDRMADERCAGDRHDGEAISPPDGDALIAELRGEIEITDRLLKAEAEASLELRARAEKAESELARANATITQMTHAWGEDAVALEEALAREAGLRGMIRVNMLRYGPADLTHEDIDRQIEAAIAAFAPLPPAPQAAQPKGGEDA